MEKILAWKMLFQRWPVTIPKVGIVVTSVNEPIAFSSFQVAEQMVLLERDRPDTTGARSIIVPWQEIVTVKLTSPIESSQFKDMGFKPVS